MSSCDSINLSESLKCERCENDYTRYCVEYRKRLCDNCYAILHKDWQSGDSCDTHTISDKNVSDFMKKDYLDALFQEYNSLAEEQRNNGIIPCFTAHKEGDQYILRIPEQLTQGGQELEGIPKKDEVVCAGVYGKGDCDDYAEWVCLDCLRYLCGDCKDKIHVEKFSTHCILPVKRYFVFKKTIELIAKNIGFEFTTESKKVQLPF